MSFIIKSLLPITTPVRLYENTEDRKEVTATNISVCNISGSAATVYLSIKSKDDAVEPFAQGAILFGYPLAANDIYIINDRTLQPKDVIEAYSDTANVIAVSIDVAGADGRYIVPL